jgi:NADH-quinone oxidoreductase subunit E
MNAPMVLSPESLARIDKAIGKYPPGQRQSAVMAALTVAQSEKGWLSTETIGFRRAVPGHAADCGLRSRELLRHV